MTQADQIRQELLEQGAIPNPDIPITANDVRNFQEFVLEQIEASPDNAGIIEAHPDLLPFLPLVSEIVIWGGGLRNRDGNTMAVLNWQRR